MNTDIFKIDASWAEKLTKTRVPFLSAPTVKMIAYYRQTNLLNCHIFSATVTDRNSDSLLGTFVTMYTKIPFTDNVIRPTDIMSSMKLNTIIFYHQILMKQRVSSASLLK